MGGYHQFRGDTPGVFLQPNDVVELVSEGLIVPPSEEEINDRSKSDSFSKLFAVVQTLWFVIQYFARMHYDLAFSPLEVVTLGYTIVTLGLYVCWRNKPFDLKQPIRIPAHVWSGSPTERCGSRLNHFLSVIIGTFFQTPGF